MDDNHDNRKKFADEISDGVYHAISRERSRRQRVVMDSWGQVLLLISLPPVATILISVIARDFGLLVLGCLVWPVIVLIGSVIILVKRDIKLL